MGGLAAAVGIEREPRFQAGIIIDAHDGDVPDAAVGTTDTCSHPSFGREQRTANQCKLWDNLRGPGFAANFKRPDHLTTSNAVWLARMRSSARLRHRVSRRESSRPTGTSSADRAVFGLPRCRRHDAKASLCSEPVKEKYLRRQGCFLYEMA